MDFARVCGVIALGVLMAIGAYRLLGGVHYFRAVEQGAGAVLDETAARRGALGEYLSSECVTCHRKGADKNGIPDIDGRPEGELVHLLNEFKSGDRTNPAMVSVAKSLNDEQIAALAAYFAKQ